MARAEIKIPAENVITVAGKRNESTVTLICSCGCGTDLQRRRYQLKASGRHYVSVEHAGTHRTRLYLEETCGPFLGLVTEYINELTSWGYKSIGKIRIYYVPLLYSLVNTASPAWSASRPR